MESMIPTLWNLRRFDLVKNLFENPFLNIYSIPRRIITDSIRLSFLSGISLPNFKLCHGDL